jgi:hypothetical protein
MNLARCAVFGSDLGFDWNEGNASELARHHITPYEVEQVFDNEPIWSGNKRRRAGNVQMHGRTNGGRLLTIVCLLNGTTLRAVTGWDMTTGERTRYLKGR